MAEKSDKEIKALMAATGQTGRHNWMYSFMTKPLQYDLSDHSVMVTEIFLVGYCKNCDQTVSVVVPATGTLTINRAGIPKDGCDWNEKPA